MKKEGSRFTVALSFVDIKFPPFDDILLLGKKCPQGKAGMSKCLHLLEPDRFEMFEIDDPVIEAILISKKILKRMPMKKIIEILKAKVFPFIMIGECVKVDFNVTIYHDQIEGTL
ncbi:MAG TPA: hypothetical protein VMW78_05970 [Anaerolineae bacterium]|nr:hypothetical protein [Anaerolineae bacterium]